MKKGSLTYCKLNKRAQPNILYVAGIKSHNQDDASQTIIHDKKDWNHKELLQEVNGEDSSQTIIHDKKDWNPKRNWCS